MSVAIGDELRGVDLPPALAAWSGALRFRGDGSVAPPGNERVRMWTEALMEEPKTTIDKSQATPELWAALAKAQSQVSTVRKSGHNKHAGYNYSTAEDMIAAGRAGRKGTELALVTNWRLEPRDGAPPMMHLEWLLAHSSGGLLTGSIAAPIQSSKRNGTDKQTAALASYLEGFVERGVMRLDREGTPPDEDRDSQDDEREIERHPPPSPRREPSKPVATPPARVVALAERIEAGEIRPADARAIVWAAIQEAADDATKRAISVAAMPAVLASGVPRDRAARERNAWVKVAPEDAPALEDELGGGDDGAFAP